jgi:hypothetical protein
VDLWQVIGTICPVGRQGGRCSSEDENMSGRLFKYAARRGKNHVRPESSALKVDKSYHRPAMRIMGLKMRHLRTIHDHKPQCGRRILGGSESSGESEEN